MDDNDLHIFDVSVVIPAYSEQTVIASVVERVISTMDCQGYMYEVIVVDDGSRDGTAAAASVAGAKVISHPYNIGNGAAVKTGIRSARGRIIVTLDGDGQHPPEMIPQLLARVGTYDMVVGARNRESDTCVHRDIANWIYNSLAGYVCGRRIEDLTSGFRAIKGYLARNYVYLLPNTFSYPTTITLAVARSGHSFTYVPIRSPKRIGRSKIRVLRDGSRFFLIIVKVSTFFSPLKIFIPASLFLFAIGFFYGLLKVLVLGERYGPTSAMLMTIAAVVFLIGLVSEQVAQLRFDRSEVFSQRKSEVWPTTDISESNLNV